MYLRTIADTAAVLALVTGWGHSTGDLAPLLIGIRLLQSSWQHALHRTESATSRDLCQLTEELLVAQLLIRLIAQILRGQPDSQRAGVQIARNQAILCERFLKSTLGRVDVLSEGLRLERIQRTLERWTETLSQAARRSAPHPLFSVSLRSAVSSRHCSDALRSELLQQLCNRALSLIPAAAFQSSGQLKPLSQRPLEFHGDESLRETNRCQRTWASSLFDRA